MDQASVLRQLVLRAKREERSPARAARVTLFASGKSGVGTTTLALNLAVQLAAVGRRVALIDANLANAGATTLLGVHGTNTIIDVLTSQAVAGDSLVPHPSGIHLLPGLWGGGQLLTVLNADCARLADQLMNLEGFDETIVDLGREPAELVRALWNVADNAALVVTPESTALVDSYALVKQMSPASTGRLFSIVNQAPGPETAAELSRRLTNSARQFLGRQIEALGWLPRDHELEAATRQRRFDQGASGDSAARLAEIADRLARASAETTARNTCAR